jgi:protease-4
VVIAVVSLMTLTGIILSILVAGGGGAGLGLGGRIAVLEVEGVITDDEEFLERVRAFRDDPSIKGWVVAINSPGGVVAPSQSMYNTLRRIRDEDGEPVVAVIGAVGASGGYYVALGADSILAMPGSITGSIGVIMEYPNVRELLDKVGVEMEVVKSGAQKDLGSPFRDMSPAERALLSAMVEDVHAQFVEVVAEARGMPAVEVLPLADGRIFSGRQALTAGLVDRMGNVEEGIALAGRMAGLGSDPRTARPRAEEVPWLLDALFGESTVLMTRRLARTITAPVVGAGPVLKYIVR